jgi:hypothetical protein
VLQIKDLCRESRRISSSQNFLFLTIHYVTYHTFRAKHLCSSEVKVSKVHKYHSSGTGQVPDILYSQSESIKNYFSLLIWAKTKA